MSAQGMPQTKGDGGGAGWGSRSDVAGWGVALAIGLLSLGASIFTIVHTRNNDKRVENRLDTQEERQFAIYVDLGEVPTGVYNSAQFTNDLGQWQQGDVWLSVINPNPVAIRDVWVEGPGDKFVRIFEIQACTLYVLHITNEDGVDEPLDFSPSFVYFRDPRDSWRLSADGELDDKYKELGDRWDKDLYADNGDADDLPMSNCV
jgi:hypothetical protein